MGEVLKPRPYPGRGCLAARTTEGTLCFVYFLTGRSPASQDRELRLAPNGDIAVNDSKGSDHPDPLRHYVAAARRGEWLVVGNGDQVEPLAESLAAGLPLMTAWAQHTFEPDGPIFTPRIWMAREAGTAVDCVLGCARRSRRGGGDVERMAWSIGTLEPAAGIVVTTYERTGAEVRASAVPEDVAVRGATPHQLLEEVWVALDPVFVSQHLASYPTTAGPTRSWWEHRTDRARDPVDGDGFRLRGPRRSL